MREKLMMRVSMYGISCYLAWICVLSHDKNGTSMTTHSHKGTKEMKQQAALNCYALK